MIFDGEEAVDAGGVTKEFFLLLLKELMDPVYGMFTHYTESNLLWFSDKVSSTEIPYHRCRAETSPKLVVFFPPVHFNTILDTTVSHKKH